MLSGDGLLSGATSSGGAANGGTIYKVDLATGDVTTLPSFVPFDLNGGVEPERRRLSGSNHEASDGYLYRDGGLGPQNKPGMIFKIDRLGAGYQVIHVVRRERLRTMAPRPRRRSRTSR